MNFPRSHAPHSYPHPHPHIQKQQCSFSINTTTTKTMFSRQALRKNHTADSTILSSTTIIDLHFENTMKTNDEYCYYILILMIIWRYIDS
jgi:hypothetical protein